MYLTVVMEAENITMKLLVAAAVYETGGEWKSYQRTTSTKLMMNIIHVCPQNSPGEVSQSAEAQGLGGVLHRSQIGHSKPLSRVPPAEMQTPATPGSLFALCPV